MFNENSTAVFHVTRTGTPHSLRVLTAEIWCASFLAPCHTYIPSLRLSTSWHILQGPERVVAFMNAFAGFKVNCTGVHVPLPAINPTKSPWREHDHFLGCSQHMQLLHMVYTPIDRSRVVDDTIFRAINLD